jgi:hypothetical protein
MASPDSLLLVDLTRTLDPTDVECLPAEVRPIAQAMGRSRIVWNGVIAYGHAGMYLGELTALLGNHEQADKRAGR